jgi:serine/threonine protein kinase
MAISPSTAAGGDPLVATPIQSQLQPHVVYRLKRLLAVGGTARAYYALRQGPEGEAPVVVKVILPNVVRDGGDTALLVIRKEAVALGRLNERIPPSPYVVRLVDTGTIDWRMEEVPLSLPWLAVEFVDGGAEGTALDERVAYSMRLSGFAFDPERAARAAYAIAQGLDEIHAVGVVHRDITPANILCCGSGETEIFKIADFGIARPLGLKATFGELAIGTPGYLAPEQSLLTKDVIGPHTDIFAFASALFFLLSGEHYFTARNVIDAYQQAMSKERRSLLATRGLCNELRCQPQAVQALDAALARATSADIEQRPRTASLFADSVLPWLSLQPQSVRLSSRWIDSIQALRGTSVATRRSWMIRHTPGERRIVLSAAWNAAGHCLATTPSGLDYFDGTMWSHVSDQSHLDAERTHFVKRHKPTSWLVGTSGARLVEIDRQGVSVVLQGPDRNLDFMALDGQLDDLCVILAHTEKKPPSLCTLVGRRWLKPFVIDGVAHISALARIDDESWLVAGRKLSGEAWVAIYEPLQLELRPMEVPGVRALLACSSRQGEKRAVAVGTDGAWVDARPDNMHCERVPGNPDFSCVTMDAAGRCWSASRGQLWARDAEGTIRCIWHNPQWTAPFVSLHAETGNVMAVTVDGGVIEGRVSSSDSFPPT